LDCVAKAVLDKVRPALGLRSVQPQDILMERRANACPGKSGG
jgi:hypothetical protein